MMRILMSTQSIKIGILYKDRLNEAVITRTNSPCFRPEIRKLKKNPVNYCLLDKGLIEGV